MLIICNMQENSIEHLLEKYENELKELYANFNKSFNDTSSLCDISKYQIFSGGKRIRPLIIFIIANLLSKKITKKTIDFATCIELLHNATLIHDDVIDDSNYRRSKPTVKKEFGVSKAILSGDYLFAYAFDYIIELPKSLIIETQKTALKLIEGEYKELEINLSTVSTDDTFTIMERKTASLFSLSTLGAYLLNIDKDMSSNKFLEKSFKDLGTYIGMCFQIMDDILDIAVTKEISGKMQGIDFVERKPSIIVTLWLREKTSLSNDFLNKKTDILKLLPNIQQEVSSLKIIQQAMEYFEKYYTLSKKTLDSLKLQFSNDFNILELENYLKNIKNTINKKFL